MSGRVGVGILAFSCGKVCGVEYGYVCTTERLFIPSVFYCVYCVCMPLLAHGSEDSQGHKGDMGG